MVKRTFIPCVHNHKSYKLYTDDIRKIHKRPKKPTPKLPPFHLCESPKKWEEITEIEFEPFDIQLE